MTHTHTDTETDTKELQLSGQLSDGPLIPFVPADGGNISIIRQLAEGKETDTSKDEEATDLLLLLLLHCILSDERRD
jgi:hypothetical protein